MNDAAAAPLVDSAGGVSRVRRWYRVAILCGAGVLLVGGLSIGIFFIADRARGNGGRDPKSVRPVVINTWPWPQATSAAYDALQSNKTSMDAVVAACTKCEELQCDGTVGFGGSPDTNGETTLDAMVMSGATQRVGAVGYLRRIKQASQVARAVFDYTNHSLLAGDGATQFAVMMGFDESNLTTPDSESTYLDWRANSCQPNFFRNVVDQSSSCPPYRPLPPKPGTKTTVSRENHDTIGVLALDASGYMSAGTSTNGANHKIAGRIGDSPLPGAGAYVDDGIGAAAATGDGDVMLRHLPAYFAVQRMSQGRTPTQACEDAIRMLARKHPDIKAGLVCLDRHGRVGGAGHGWTFSFAYQSPETEGSPRVVHVEPVSLCD